MLDGCVDHRAGIPDEDLHRHATETIARADALLFGRVTYQMMESAWRGPPVSDGRPAGMHYNDRSPCVAAPVSRSEARLGGIRTSQPDRGTALVPEPPLTRQGIAWLVI
jgi:hypothetical protein